MTVYNRPLRIVFMGTPDFAAIVLQRLVVWDKGKVVASYCQPDRPAGRGQKLHASPVKVFSNSLSIPVYQPIDFRSKDARNKLRSFDPDLLVVAAYGLILPQQVLDIPHIAPLNVHASLLPFYRGAAPIQRAVMSGDKMTGITIMHMEKGLDTGPIVAQRALAIDITDTAGTIHDQLAHLGAKLLIEVLDQIIQGTIPEPTAQDESRATYAAKLTKADGNICWDMPVQMVHNTIRGITPWPGAHTVLTLPNHTSLSVKVQPGIVGNSKYFDYNAVTPPFPGTILGLTEEGIAIACKDAPYIIHTICPAGGKMMCARDFWNGYIKHIGPCEIC